MLCRNRNAAHLLIANTVYHSITNQKQACVKQNSRLKRRLLWTTTIVTPIQFPTSRLMLELCTDFKSVSMFSAFIAFIRSRIHFSTIYSLDY